MFDASTTTRSRRPAGDCRFASGHRRTRDDSDRRHEWRAVVAILLPAAGCGLAPSVSILGSFFPAWLICMVIGVALTVVSVRVLVAMEVAAHLGPPALVYPSLGCLWIFATWLLVFGS